MTAPVRTPTGARLDPWFARVETEQARMRAERATRVPRPPSAAEAAFIAALQDHAGRLVEARRETLRQFGDDAEARRDVRLDLGGDHRLVAHSHPRLP